MKTFNMKQIAEAKAYAGKGHQALHVHNINTGHRLFKRYPVIGHLFDIDKARLIATARRLGVRVIKVERQGQDGQHIDLCGKPFERALEMSTAYIPCHVIPHVYDSNDVCLNCGYVKTSSAPVTVGIDFAGGGSATVQIPVEQVKSGEWIPINRVPVAETEER